MRLIVIVLVFLLVGNLTIQCQQIQVRDQESWYEDDLSSKKIPNQKDNISKNSNNPNYHKLLSVERQILMSEQMIKLYQERLSVLMQLRKQLKSVLYQQKIDSQLQEESSQSSGINTKFNTQNGGDSGPKRAISEQNKQFQNNNPTIKYGRNPQTSYVFLKQYQVDVTSSTKYLQSQGTPFVESSILLIPPFIINKAKSYVSILNSHQNSSQILKYQYGLTSNRLLFYSVDKRYQEGDMDGDQNGQGRGAHHTMNLAVQIKPNKIKSVKINYHQRAFSNNSALPNDFNVQQVVTSYESNELISQNFKWHKALQFENQIIGFANEKVYIKGKDKKMNEVDIGSRVLAIYSLNQYKILYIAEDKVGTINVRSLTRSDQIRYQYYLGNKTLIKQKEIEKKTHSQNVQVQEDYSHESFDPGSYWHSPFTKNFSTLRALSVHHLQPTKQVLILLSNGELFLHSNQKFTASINLGTQLIKILNFGHLEIKNQLQFLSKIHIKIQLLPSYNQLLISSNFYNKILIYNVTIPYLTQISTGISFFTSSTRANELSAKYWKNLEISGKQQMQKVEKKINPQDTQIYFFITSPVLKQGGSQVAKRSIDLDQKVLLIYYCQHSNQKINSFAKHQQKDSDKHALEQALVDYITISEYRMLLNLFDQNSLGTTASQANEGRSFWWNILLVAMIGIGVFVFRKCKQSSQPKQQWEDPASQKSYKSKKISHSTNNTSIDKKFPKITKQQDKIDKRPTTTKTKIEYDNMVISQLQNYLEKQGQKLSKQQIAFMIRQMQQNQQNQTLKKQLKREQKTEQIAPEHINLIQNNNSKHPNEKQHKKINDQEKSKLQKVSQNLKKKKQ